MAEKTETLDFGAFEVRSVDEGGAEVRLASEKKGSTFVLRNKSIGKGLQRGQWVELTGTVREAPPEQVVTAEGPAELASELPAEFEVVGKAHAKKGGK